MDHPPAFPRRELLARIIILVIVWLPAAWVTHVHAHGGVYLEDDLCVIKIGFYDAHFTIFQPRSRGHEQYCEDLPVVGETVFVLEYLHNGLEDLPVDFRIIRNTTNVGLFATWQDVAALADLDAVTVYFHPPKREMDVYSVIYDFVESGEYIGIVTSTHQETGAFYAAVFPFEVGYAGVNYLAIGGGMVIVALLAWVSTLLRGLWRHRAGATAMLLIGLVAMTPGGQVRAAEIPRYYAEGSYFAISLQSQLQPLGINQMHTWRLHLTDREGKPVNNADITVRGGMPAHNHGFPTSPRVIQGNADGDYIIQGMKFHMRGRWELAFVISAQDQIDAVTVAVEL